MRRLWNLSRRSYSDESNADPDLYATSCARNDGRASHCGCVVDALDILARCDFAKRVQQIKPIELHRSIPTMRAGGHASQSPTPWRRPMSAISLVLHKLAQKATVFGQYSALASGVYPASANAFLPRRTDLIRVLVASVMRYLPLDGILWAMSTFEPERFTSSAGDAWRVRCSSPGHPPHFVEDGCRTSKEAQARADSLKALEASEDNPP